MIPFKVTILGSNSAIPTTERNPTSQLVEYNGNMFMVDCGEGTQVRLRELKVHFQRINHIFISHLHGDHFFGLIGFVSSLHLLGRKKELHIYGPPELEEVILLQLRVSATTLQYPLFFHSTQGERVEVVYEDENLRITSFPMKHRIPTTGFLFSEKKGDRRINKELAVQLNIPFQQFEAIKKGADFTDTTGKVFKNSVITRDPLPVRTYAFCSDTAFDESIVPVVKNADLLYHETTFMQAQAANAAEKFHSTTLEAATIARMAGVKKLIIGHFSARYDDPQGLLAEARTVFPDTELALERITFNI